MKTNKPIKIGVTGGIGSGKTTACKMFEKLGIPVYYSDDKVRNIMNTNPEVINKVTTLFGPEAYVDGQLNRVFIGNKAFNDKTILEQLNSIVYPYALEDMDKWFNELKDTPYALYESAILFEMGADTKLDKVITVCTPIGDRIHRTVTRDNLTPDQVLARIDKQLSDDEKIARADYIITNGGKLNTLEEQVNEMHNFLIK